jgi:hypothetical protein
MDMILRHFTTFSSLLLACLTATLVTGCGEGPGPATTTNKPRPTPEESFEQIVQLVRDGLEMPGGGAMMVTQRDGSSSRFQVHNTITSKVTPPAKPEGPYRATLTVTSRSVYSLRKIEEEADEEPAEQSGFGMSEESEVGMEVMDEELVTSKPDTKTGGQELEKVQRHSDEEVRNIDFIYENERWILNSQIDPEARGEAALAGAIKRALNLQP